MNEVSFARPYLLMALILVPVAYAVWALASRRAYRRAQAISRDSAGRPRYISALLLTLGAALAIVASAQPRWGTEQSVIPRRSAEVIFVVDVSRSMDAKDVAPSRLEAAKTALTTTIQRLQGDRIGLVIFAGNARLRFPLTTDRSAANQVIAALETGAILVQGGTSAASGLDIALDSFDKSRDAGRLIVFISDGEDLGADPAAAAAKIHDAGVDFMAVGTGTANGATIPVYDARTKSTTDKLTRDGKAIVSKLNEPFLKALAVTTGGRYLGADLAALPGAVAGRIDSLKRRQTDDLPSNIPVERFQWFAGAALACLFLASMGERVSGLPGRKAALGAAVTALSLLIAGCATDVHDLNADGLAAYNRGDYETAINHFLDARALDPDNPAITLNLASTFDKAGRFEEASQAVRRLLVLPDPITRARGFASLGHHEFNAGHQQDALDAFRSALVDNPDDRASRHDYEVLLRLLNPDQQQPAPGQGQPPPGSPPPGGQDNPAPGNPGQDGSTPPPPSPSPGAGQGQPQATTPEALERQLRQLDGQVNALLRQAGDNPTPSQALQILQLLAERNRLAAQRDAFAGGGDPNDY